MGKANSIPGVIGLCISLSLTAAARAHAQNEVVYLDKQGVVRWRDSDKECDPAAGHGGTGDHLRLEHLERIQLSLRPHEGRGVEVEWIALAF